MRDGGREWGGGERGRGRGMRDGRVCAGERERGRRKRMGERYRYYLVQHVNTTTGSVLSNSNGFPYHPNQNKLLSAK